MLHLVALTPAVPRIVDLPFRSSLCIVTSLELLEQACAARARDVVLVPLGRLPASSVRRLRRAMQPDALLVAVAATLAEATSASPELSVYDYVVTAAGLGPELVYLLSNRNTLELVAASA
jgi:hypothetical protein